MSVGTKKAWLSKPLSVKQLLLLGFLLTALLPMLIVMWLAFYQARSVLREEITRDMQTRATAALSEIDNMMFERLQNVVSWSRFDVMEEIRIADVDKRLSNFLSELKASYHDVYQDLYVVNNKDVIVASSNPGQIGKKIDPMPHWRELWFVNHNLYLGKIEQQALPIATDVFDADQKKIGTLYALFNWDHILKVLKNTENKGSAAALLDAKGEELAYTAEWHTIITAHDVAVTSDPKMLSSLPIFDWQVSIAQYRSVVMKPVQRMGIIFLVLLAATAFLTAILAAPLSRRITKPLASLTDYASGFIRSSQATLPPVDGPAEVRAMSDAFGKMMDDLAKSKENLTRAAKLAVAGEMAAAMSHEVRTPLGILRSSAQVLAREKNISPEGREVTQFITTEADRLNKLVSTLVDSARPRQPEFAMHDIVHIAEHAMAMLRMQANKKDVDLQFNTDQLAHRQLFVECDGEQITQVILNLILNAIQVLSAGGKIVVTLFETKDNVTISVADNGPGVDASQKEQIFDPFFTQRPGGIGLGLAVSRQIVTAHFGTLNVDNTDSSVAAKDINKGADFRVTLPKLQIQ
jgi:signal transduction histidine kinase